MQIIISEAQEERLINLMLQEDTYQHDYSTLNLALKKFMDDNFQRGKTKPSLNDSGDAERQEVAVLVSNGQLLKPMTDLQLAEFLQAKKSNILPKENRDQYIKEFLIKWYQKKINPKTGSFLP